MSSIGEWLASLGLAEYSQRFADNAIDLSVVRDLTEEDLRELGLPIGHRRKLQRAIAELNGAAPAIAQGPAKPLPRDDAAERRHLTVMICDLVGSTAPSHRLDPEDLRQVIGSYRKWTSQVIARYPGFVASSRDTGDGI